MGFILTFIMERIVKLPFIAGHRTALGGAFLMLTGVGLIVNMLATGNWDSASATQAGAMIGGGLVAIGVHGKFSSVLEALGKDK